MYSAYLFLKILSYFAETDTSYILPIPPYLLENHQKPITLVATIPPPSQILSLLPDLRSQLINILCFVYYLRNI